MAKAKAVKKKKTNPVWTKIWNETKFFLTSLLSNDTCIEGRHKKWYLAVCTAIVSCVLAVVPTMSTQFSKSGSSFLDSPLYDYEIGLTSFTEEIASKGLKFKISEEGYLLVDGENAENNGTAFTVCHSTGIKKNGSEDTYDFSFYVHSYETEEIKLVSEATGDDSSSSVTPTIPTYTKKTAIDFAAYVVSDDISPVTFATNTILKGDDPNKSLGSDVSSYQTNFIVFGKDHFYAVKKPSGVSANPKASIYCSYKNANLIGKSFADLTKQDLFGNAYEAAGLSQNEYRAKVANSWKQVFAAGWDETRISMGWQYTGICFAINVGTTFLLGLMVFLMTRGKNNPFRTYTFWDAQKIAYFASLTPAILSLLGFIQLFAALNMFLYMLLFGLRIMWMSTKSLRPYQN